MHPQGFLIFQRHWQQIVDCEVFFIWGVKERTLGKETVWHFLDINEVLETFHLQQSASSGYLRNQRGTEALTSRYILYLSLCRKRLAEEKEAGRDKKPHSQCLYHLKKPEGRRERGHDMRQRAEERFRASSWLNAFSEKRNWCAIPTEWSWLDAENYQRSTHLDHASWSWLMLYISLSWPGWKQRSSKKCGSTDPFLCKRTFICEGSSATWFFHFFLNFHPYLGTWLFFKWVETTN